jgi:hypothetical protein
MGRRILAGVLVAVGLLAASVAWWGLTLQRTVFDSGRSTKLARALLSSGQVQDALVGASTKAVEGALPASVRTQVPTEQISAAARAALTSPAVTNTLESALVGTHQYLIGDRPDPPTLDSAPIDAALRQQLVAIRPDLAAVVPTLPPLEVQLPDTGLPAVRGLRQQVSLVTLWTTAVAVVAIALAFLAARSRRAVLRRVGFWALTTGGLWVALRYVLPAIVRAVVPSSAALVGGLAEAMAEGMAVPGVLLAVGGVAALGASMLPAGLPTGPARGARAGGRPGRSGRRIEPPAPSPEPRRPLEPRPTAPVGRAERPKPYEGAGGQREQPLTTPLPRTVAGPANTWPHEPQPAPSSPAPSSPAPSSPAPSSRAPSIRAAANHEVGHSPRWVPGYGYVLDEPLAEGGRWVDGVGFVLE